MIAVISIDSSLEDLNLVQSRVKARGLLDILIAGRRVRNGCGSGQVVLCERGINDFEQFTRFT